MNIEVAIPKSAGKKAADLFLAPNLRILFVIDGRIALHKEPDLFGLGFVLDTLRHTKSTAARIQVDIATREEAIDPFDLGSNTVNFVGFKFTQSDFQIDDYHQIWIFADQPNKDDGADTDTDQDIAPPYVLEDAEVKRIAEWMDRGGGVFATGDHGVLGASLGSRIPRVRTMRRWTRVQGVPSNEGARRNQTLQGEHPGSASERDATLQPLELVYLQSVQSPPFYRTNRPHPLMCSRFGPIDHFPDHMHEGELVPDGQVELNRALNIPGYDRPEYPPAIGDATALEGLHRPPFRPQPRPLIVAYGRTTNPGPFAPAGTEADTNIAYFFPISFKRFGLVSAYDGHSAGVGRVVCDSTWHHWLSYNLVNIAATNSLDYQKMQAYYRNIAFWLANIEQQQAMLVSASWSAMTDSPEMAFSDRHTPWEVGERALEILGAQLAPCWINELVASNLDLTELYLARIPGELDSLNPDWTGLPEELVNRAVVGCLCNALRRPADEAKRALSLKQDPKIDAKTIRQLAAKGVGEAAVLIRQNLDEAVAGLSGLRDRLSPGRSGK